MISQKIKLYGIIFSLVILIVSAVSIQLVLNPDEVDIKEQEMVPQAIEREIQKIEIWEDTAINESCKQPMPPEIFIVGANKEDATRNENGTYTVIDAGEKRIIAAQNYSSIYQNILFVGEYEGQEPIVWQDMYLDFTKYCIQHACSQANKPASTLPILATEQFSTNSTIPKMNIHPNGNILVTVSEQSGPFTRNFARMHLYDQNLNHIHEEWINKEHPQSTLTGFAIHPNGNIVVRGYVDEKSDGFMHLFDENLNLVDKTIIYEYGHTAISIHPNGNIIVHGYVEEKTAGFIHLYDESLDLVDNIIVEGYGYNALSIHPNGNIVASDRARIHTYDEHLDLVDEELVDDNNRISELTIYPNGNIVIVSDNTLIRIYDEQLNIIREEHAGENTADQFHDMIVDPINDNLIIAGERHPARTEAAPDGSMFYRGAQALVQVYDTNLAKINEDQFGNSNKLSAAGSIAIHPSGYIIVIGYINQMPDHFANVPVYPPDAFLRIYDVDFNLIHVEQIASCTYDHLYDVSVHQNGNIIVTGYTQDSSSITSKETHPFVRIYDISKIEEIYG